MCDYPGCPLSATPAPYGMPVMRTGGEGEEVGDSCPWAVAREAICGIPGCPYAPVIEKSCGERDCPYGRRGSVDDTQLAAKVCC